MTPFTATASMSRMLIVGLVLVAGALAPVVPAEASAGSAQASQQRHVRTGQTRPQGPGVVLHKLQRALTQAGSATH